MLYYQTEIKPYDPNSAELVDSHMVAYKISRAILAESIFDKEWYLTFRLAPEGEKNAENFVMAPRVYNGHDDNKGLLELMGIELPDLKKTVLDDITRLQGLEGEIINMVTLKNGLRALYYIPKKLT